MTEGPDELSIYRGDDDYRDRLGKKNKRADRRSNQKKYKKHGRKPDEVSAIVPTPDHEEHETDWNDVNPDQLEQYAREIYDKITRIGIFAKTDKFDQHFLIDPVSVQKISEAADIKTGDSVLEVGPGPGNLTENIWNVCRQVRASLSTIELDVHFRTLLEELPDSRQINMYWGDAIHEMPTVVKQRQINKVVANIPYSILEPLLRQIHASRSIQSAVLLVGKRYAERAVADFRDEDPSGEGFSRTSLFSQARFQPEIIAEVPREKFMPPPRTESAIVRLNAKGGKSSDFITVANALIKRPTTQVRTILQNLLQQRFNKGKLRQIRSLEEAYEVQGALPPRIDQLGFPDEFLNSSLKDLTNSQLQALLLKLDLLKKKQRRDRKIDEAESDDETN